VRDSTIFISFSISKALVLYYNVTWIIMKYYALLQGGVNNLCFEMIFYNGGKNETTSGIYR